MKLPIKKQFPPNYNLIKETFPSLEKYSPVFAFDGVIYNPFDQEIYPDLELHEGVHLRQQKEYGSADLWWRRYIMDSDFRYQEELIAYATQYNFVKINLPKATKESVDNFADALSSSLYNLGISKSQAATAIRLKAKLLNSKK